MHFRSWMVLFFLLIGIGNRLLISPMSILVPLVIAGIVYYLYKYPPGWLCRLSGSHFSKKQTNKKRKNPFKVISGKK